MARQNIIVCDRCGNECKGRYGRTLAHSVRVGGKDMDLCPSCWSQLESWLRKDNATQPGDSVEWEEVCTHNIPCAGPCNSGTYRRRR